MGLLSLLESLQQGKRTIHVFFLFFLAGLILLSHGLKACLDKVAGLPQQRKDED